MLQKIRRWASKLKAELLVLWFCRSHPDTPLAAKLLAILVVAYAFSPIDLIPDFIPVLGYLDDVILVPLGIWLALKLIPEHVIAESRLKADAWVAERKRRAASYLVAALIVLTWIALAWWAWRWISPAP
ncbi:MAG: YkvA family protein [Betaproteobacteria bacterium]